MDYKNYALFMDCDMLLRCDIRVIIDVISVDPSKAVYVVKHDYDPSTNRKYLNNVQYAYPRINWSSFVVCNCNLPKNKTLTPDFINTASGLELHRFTWSLR